MLAIVDSGPLYAVVDADDDEHSRCRELLERRELELIVPALVVAEVTYLVGRRLGPKVEAEFLRGLTSVEVEAPLSDEWTAIADMVDRYSNFPLGGTDASVAVLADRVGTDLIVTLDHRRFGAIRSSSGGGFTLLPE